MTQPQAIDSISGGFLYNRVMRVHLTLLDEISQGKIQSKPHCSASKFQFDMWDLYCNECMK